MHTSEYIAKSIAFKDANPLDSMIMITFHHEYLDQRKNGETFDEYMERQYEIALMQEADSLQEQEYEANSIGQE